MQYRHQLRSSEESARRAAVRLAVAMKLVGAFVAVYATTVFFARPFTSMSFIVLSLFLWHYLSNADSVWHSSQKTENLFWCVVAFVMSTTLMFAPDSPVQTPSLDPPLRSLLVLLTTLAAHLIDRSHHRNRLRALPHFSYWEDKIGTASEDELVRILQDLLSQLDRTLPSTLHTIFSIARFTQIEREILEIFDECSKDELNYIIVRVEMKLLAYKLKNHKKLKLAITEEQSRPLRYRSNLIDIIARRRVSDLTLYSRVVVLDVIQSLRMTTHPETCTEAQEWILNLLCTVRGDDLSELKQIVDNKGSAESMHKLIYNDITNLEVRARILKHFESQALIQAAQMAMGSSLAKRRMLKSPWRKILSDVDDTLFSSGGRYPAGVDKSYPRKVFYPGVTAFYRELNIGTVGDAAITGEWPSRRCGDLVFLSARPHVYKDVTETSMYSKFRRFMKTQSLYCMPSLLPGDIDSGHAFMMRGDFLPMAMKKAQNFQQYYSIFPEYKHIFIGDNGQADVRAAEFMMKQFGNLIIERVYIHQVQPREFTYGYEAGTSEEKWKRMGIVFCRSYVAAAIDAFQQGLFLIHGLHRISFGAREEFLKIRFSWRDPYERDFRRIELNQDIYVADKVLAQHGMPTIGPIPGEQHFKIGSAVYTGFGKGYVASFRAHDGIYEVLLNWKSSSAIRLFAGMHALFASERHLRDVQKRLFGHDEKSESDHRASRSSSSISKPEDLIPAEDVEVREVGSIRPEMAWNFRSAIRNDPFYGFMTPAISFVGKAEGRLRKRWSTDYGSKDAKPAFDSPVVTRARDLQKLRGSLRRLMDDGNKDEKDENDETESVASTESASVATDLDHEEILEIGKKVGTPYGDAVVLVFREEDGIYELALIGAGARAFVHEESLMFWNAKLFKDRAKAMVRGGSYPRRLMDLMRKIFLPDEKSEAILTPSLAQRPMLPVGGRVQTYFGRGKVVATRTLDHVVTVRLDLGAMAYLQRSAITALLPSHDLTPEKGGEGESPLTKAKQMVQRILPMSSLLPSLNTGSRPTLPRANERLVASSAEERRLAELWNTKAGDEVEVSGLGRGKIMDMRFDGFFVVQLSFGIGFISVPRILSLHHLNEAPLPVDSRVLTILGTGVIQGFRVDDRIYVVALEHFNARAYIYAGTMKEKQAGFRGTILNFISGFMPTSNKKRDVESGDQLRKLENGIKIPVGHTNFSWMGSSNIKVPPGHTKFSWLPPSQQHTP